MLLLFATTRDDRITFFMVYAFARQGRKHAQDAVLVDLAGKKDSFSAA